MSRGEPLTFQLSRVAHDERNSITTSEEARLQEVCRAAREVLLPGVDLATAFAMHKVPTGLAGTQTLVVERLTVTGAGTSMLSDERRKDPEAWQAAVDTGLAERGFAVRMPEAWPGLQHVVRYLDLIEKNEAPDTPLLEWLVTAGVVPGKTALATVRRFQKPTPLGRHAFVLLPADAVRLQMAAEVRQQLEAEERAAKGS